MKHQKYKKQLSAFLDNELEFNEQQALQQHLLSCAACRETLEKMQKLRQFFAVESEYQANPFLATRVMTAAAQQDTGFLGLFELLPKPVMNLSIIVALILFSIITIAPFDDNATVISSADYPIVTNSLAPSVDTYDEALEFAYLNEYSGE